MCADDIKEGWDCCITKEMPHHLFVNETKCFFIDARRFTIRYDDVVAASLSFTLTGGECVDLTTFAPVTLVVEGVTRTLAANEKFTLAVGQDVYIPLWNNPAYSTKLRVATSEPEPGAAHPTPAAVQNVRWHPRVAPKKKPKRRRVHEFHMC
jgi:hypothetical protein